MRNTERLVQVQVAYIGTVVARAAQPNLFSIVSGSANRNQPMKTTRYLCVHVGAVKIHLPAILVDDRAALLDRGLEHAMRRRVRNHEARQILRVFLGLGAKVLEVNVAIRITFHNDDAQACQRR